LAWDGGTAPAPARFEHLDLVADEEIEWEVRMEPGPALGAHPDYADSVREAAEGSPDASGVQVQANDEEGPRFGS